MQDMAPTDLTVDAVQAKLTKLQENKDLDPALKTQLTDLYGKTLEQLQAAAEAQARKDDYQKKAKNAPQTLQEKQTELNAPLLESPSELTDQSTLAQAQLQLTQAESQLADAQKSLKVWQDEPKRRMDRRAEIAKQLDACKTKLADLDQQLAAKPPADEAPDVTAAAHQLLEAKKQAADAECAAAQAELRFYEAAGELLPVRRDLAARDAARLEALVKRLRDDVNERRRREAEQQAKEARRVAARASRRCGRSPTETRNWRNCGNRWR